MLRLRTARALTAAAILGAATLGAISFAGPTSAAIGTIKCTKLVGNLNTTVTLSGCNGNTGGASMAIPATNLATGGAIPWVNGQSTTWGQFGDAQDGPARGAGGIWPAVRDGPADENRVACGGSPVKRGGAAALALCCLWR